MITKWERKELQREQRIRERKLKKELELLKEPSPYSNTGLSRADMGSERAREIEYMLSQTNIGMLERTTDLTRFMELRSRIHRLGTEDYYTRANERFMSNWKSVIERYSHFDNYNKLMEIISNYKKPKDFYYFISKTELGMDLLYNSDETYTQQEFNALLVDLTKNDKDLTDSVSKVE